LPSKEANDSENEALQARRSFKLFLSTKAGTIPSSHRYAWIHSTDLFFQSFRIVIL